jgi:hypothetical protein
MDNRETLNPSSGDAIIKRHLFFEVAAEKVGQRVDVTSGGSISSADQIDRVSDPEWPLRAAQFLEPPALPGDIYNVRSWHEAAEPEGLLYGRDRG